MICIAKRRPPVEIATAALEMVLVVSAARIGITASRAANFPAATREATETAAECVSAKPATAAAARTPARPHSLTPCALCFQVVRSSEHSERNIKTSFGHVILAFREPGLEWHAILSGCFALRNSVLRFRLFETKEMKVTRVVANGDRSFVTSYRAATHICVASKPAYLHSAGCFPHPQCPIAGPGKDVLAVMTDHHARNLVRVPH
jgi:hypothetical protein